MKQQILQYRKKNKNGSPNRSTSKSQSIDLTLTVCECRNNKQNNVYTVLSIRENKNLHNKKPQNNLV